MLKLVSLIAALGLFISAGAASAQNAEAGAAVFKKCKACHQIGPNAENKLGPTLNDLVGRAAGSVEDFKYGDSILAAGEKGLVWSTEELANYLEDPTKYMRAYLDDNSARSAMSFKLKKEQDRLDVVAYLTTAVTAEAADTTAPETPAETRTIDEIIADQVFTAEFLEDPANFAAGKDVWFAQCTHCHGYKAYPGKAPKLKPAKYKPEFVFKRVYKGFKKMPAWNEVYTIDEVRQVVAYIKGQGFAP
ncbi:c-type cytochrome [Sulfitobacter sp.]|uniref:c-type cytochrome n=1 Tax=Sulfitobacter sp. TaxID=1903071 RepID=UPI0030032670